MRSFRLGVDPVDGWLCSIGNPFNSKARQRKRCQSFPRPARSIRCRKANLMTYTKPTISMVHIENESAYCCGILGIGPTCMLQTPANTARQVADEVLSGEGCHSYAFGLVTICG